VLRDVSPDLVERGLGVARRLFGDAVSRGGLCEADAEAGLARITGTTTWKGFDACDLVIEAIVENAGAKRRLFAELDGIVRPDTILASNSSALPIEETAGQVSHPGRTLGIHFFNPVGRMPLVELIIGRDTSAQAADRALGFVKGLGKSPVICRSSPGFLVTRVLFFYLNEAVRLWERGVPTEALDDAMREFGWPMGPMRLVDEVGVDVTEFIFGEMAGYFPDRFVRTQACARLLAAGLRGRKNGAGAGFYSYADGRERVNDRSTRGIAGRGGREAGRHHSISASLMAVMVAEATHCLEEGVVQSEDDADFALLAGAGFPAFRGGLMRCSRAIAEAGAPLMGVPMAPLRGKRRRPLPAEFNP
jgi:3-hydroxyacyl-CoA dehydrogenase/enoyl-CoA hydratase/3-hydroxybutyryl-CoA epimerase